MRIIAGTFKGRILADPTSRVTHPMSEKIRGALFNTLGDVQDLSLLDAFAGTGSVAIEAISRGASTAVTIDNDVNAYKCVTENVRNLDLKKRITVVCANVSTWSKNNPAKLFDLIVADAPFNQVNDDTLAMLAKHATAKGVFVASIPTDFSPKSIPNMTLVKSKTYGNAKMHFYKRATT